MNILKFKAIIDLEGMPPASILRLLDTQALIESSASTDEHGRTEYHLREGIKVNTDLSRFTMLYTSLYATEAIIEASRYPSVYAQWSKKLEKVESSKLLGQRTGRQYSKIEDAIKDAYIDLHVYLHLAYHCYASCDDHWTEYADRCRAIAPSIQFVQSETGPSKGLMDRAELFERLKRSLIYTRTNEFQLTEPLQSAAQSMNPLEIEHQHDVKPDLLLSVLSDYSRALDGLEIENRDFHLRFRKTGNHHFAGCYHPPTKTIVVDPRHTEVFYHELGHYLHIEGVPFVYKRKRYSLDDMEAAIDSSWPTYIDEVSGYKHYDDDDYRPEVFARWFSHEVCGIPRYI